MITETINLLGRKARDKVTAFEGVVTSVSFDLYGCVQVVLQPPLGADGKPADGAWMDVARLEMLKAKPAMGVPDFDAKGKMPERYDSGPAEKPAARSLPVR